MGQWGREWLVVEEGGTRTVPGLDWLMDLPRNVRLQLIAILDAVRTTGPDQWADPNTHKAMKGDLAHVHEVRDKHGTTLYRLFVLWQRDERRVVVLDGRTKANNTMLSDADYEEIRRLGELAGSSPPPFASFDDFAQARLQEEDEDE